MSEMNNAAGLMRRKAKRQEVLAMAYRADEISRTTGLTVVYDRTGWHIGSPDALFAIPMADDDPPQVVDGVAWLRHPTPAEVEAAQRTLRDAGIVA